MTPEENARQARGNAALNYRQRAVEFVIRGDRLYLDGLYSGDPLDAEGAVALWLDGMKALDAALEVEKGLTSDPWRGTAFGSN